MIFEKTKEIQKNRNKNLFLFFLVNSTLFFSLNQNTFFSFFAQLTFQLLFGFRCFQTSLWRYQHENFVVVSGFGGGARANSQRGRRTAEKRTDRRRLCARLAAAARVGASGTRRGSSSSSAVGQRSGFAVMSANKHEAGREACCAWRSERGARRAVWWRARALARWQVSLFDVGPTGRPRRAAVARRAASRRAR